MKKEMMEQKLKIKNYIIINLKMLLHVNFHIHFSFNHQDEIFVYQI